MRGWVWKKPLNPVDAKNFCTVWAAYQSTDGLDTGWICVCGGVEPKTLHQVW